MLPFPEPPAHGLRAFGPPELARTVMGRPCSTAPKGNGFIAFPCRAMTQQGAERAVPATGHLMAPEAARDKEVSPEEAGWGDKPWTLVTYTLSLPHDASASLS